MRKITQSFLTLVLFVVPTLQLSAKESEQTKFKQELLEAIQEEIPDLSPAEINRIIDEVEASLAWEDRPEEELMTKDELYLLQHRDEVSSQKLQAFATPLDGKPEEQAILEELNPKLKMLPDDSYHYNTETNEIDVNVSKDAIFNAEEPSMAQASPWSLLEKGDVLINFDNGSSAFRGQNLFKWGHAGLMYSKGVDPTSSRTIEAPGSPKKVQFVNYNDVWHSNTKNRMTYNYVPRIYRTNKPTKASSYATRYLGRPYGLFHKLGNAYEIYCTELIFLAYLSQGVNLGNGLKLGSWGILTPGKMYCDADLMYYYRQKVGGGMC